MFKKKSTVSDDIKLSKDQKENIKITLNQALKKYDLRPSPINIGLPIDNINELDKNKDKNLNALKSLVLKALKNECPLKENEIIYSHFFQVGMHMDMNVTSTYLTAGGCFYFQIYMSDKEIVIYGLDNYYKLIKSRKLNISDIDSVGVYNKDLCGLKLSKENLILKINPSASRHLSNLSSYYLLPLKKDNIFEMTEFRDLLLSLGVPELLPPKKGIGAIIYFILMAFIILIGILWLYSFYTVH